MIDVRPAIQIFEDLLEQEDRFYSSRTNLTLSEVMDHAEFVLRCAWAVNTLREVGGGIFYDQGE